MKRRNNFKDEDWLPPQERKIVKKKRSDDAFTNLYKKYVRTLKATSTCQCITIRSIKCFKMETLQLAIDEFSAHTLFHRDYYDVVEHSPPTADCRQYNSSGQALLDDIRQKKIEKLNQARIRDDFYILRARILDAECRPIFGGHIYPTIQSNLLMQQQVDTEIIPLEIRRSSISSKNECYTVSLVDKISTTHVIAKVLSFLVPCFNSNSVTLPDWSNQKATCKMFTIAAQSSEIILKERVHMLQKINSWKHQFNLNLNFDALFHMLAEDVASSKLPLIRYRQLITGMEQMGTRILGECSYRHVDKLFSESQIQKILPRAKYNRVPLGGWRGLSAVARCVRTAR